MRFLDQQTQLHCRVAAVLRQIRRLWLRRSLIVGILTLAGLGVRATAAEAPLPETIQFNRDIRPVLSDKCYYCHGPDKNKRKAKLRLDTREGLFAPRSDVTPVVPGQLEQSEVFHRITTSDMDDHMPPPESGKKLSAHQIALLKRWIAQGADWEGHWAYLAPVRHALPEVRQQDWPLNPIDDFILARLEKEKLDPSQEADRRTLLRRLKFDLTGLPPTPAELAAFEKDASPDAYDRLVDRLLDSPHFGERMAMYWLDVVRYADTDGYHSDNYRSVWPYRDYVIGAFNQNLPFDQFTTEQLAGDLLPEPSRRARIASTYNRLGRTTEEGGAQPKEYLAKYAADRVRAVATVWLGSTMACCECHDHKFDPFKTKDFYRMEAFFADVKEQGVGKPEPVKIPTSAQETKLQQLDQQMVALTQQLDTPTADLEASQAKWEAKLQADRAAGRLGWTVIKPVEFVSQHGATLKLLDDHSLLAEGKNPDKDVYQIKLRTEREHLTGLRLEALTHPSLTHGRLSRANGNFVLTEVEVAVTAKDATNSRPVSIASALADFAQKDYPISAAIDGKADTGWAVEGHVKAADHQAVFIFKEPIAGGPGTILTVTLKHESQFKQHNLGRFRLAVISVDQPGLGKDGLPDEIATILGVTKDQRTGQQHQELAKYYRSMAPELDPVRDQLAQTKQARKEFEESIPTTLATVTVKPRTIRVLPRGNWQDDSGEIVTPAVPEFLPHQDIKDRRATRLDLAKWLVSRDNPLTARVFVNRLWKLFFGTGISRTLDDFGAQGEWPLHPELLDWLAVEFEESGWDVKHIVRLIVTCQTYRQGSKPREDLREIDPHNRLLARQSRFRLDAEMVHDNALAISGLLVDQIGGPSVKPYQPAGYWAQLNFPKRKWEQDDGPSLYRRGLYTFWCRTFLHPSLLAFDAPSREECTAERETSNTPQQALTLLNDPIFVEAARVLAAKVIEEGGKTLPARLNWTFQRALNRPPEAAEARLLDTFYHKERERYAADPDAAKKLLSVGDEKVPAGLDVSELAAWSSVARVVLNLHETIERF